MVLTGSLAIPMLSGEGCIVRRVNHTHTHVSCLFLDEYAGMKSSVGDETGAEIRDKLSKGSCFLAVEPAV